MIRRDRKITFRLTPAEEDRFGNLMKQLRCWHWSEFVRLALKRFAEKCEQPASDNNVGQPIGSPTLPALSDKTTSARKKTAGKKFVKAKKK